MIAAIITGTSSDGVNRTVSFNIDQPSGAEFQLAVATSASAAQLNAAVVAMAAAETNTAVGNILLFGGAQ